MTGSSPIDPKLEILYKMTNDIIYENPKFELPMTIFKFSVTS